MIHRLSLFCLVAVFSLSALAAQAQTGRQQPVRNDTKSGEPSPQEKREQEQTETDEVNPKDLETLKVNTNLVTVPVIANDREGDYIPDLRKEEFTIFEDGVRQELSFFATVDEPFHVVLMIDTSASTQIKLRQIQRAAVEFTGALQQADRLKVISFDDAVRDLCDFSNDRLVLQKAIQSTKPGEGTKLYDAMRLALESLRPIKGRKAIVIFTDGVDWHSDMASFDENRRMIEESGVIVYPIRYDTRLETERLAREQASGGGLDSIFGGGKRKSSTTPPTFPTGGQGPSQIPGRSDGPLGGIPQIPIIIRRDPRDSRDPRDPGGQYPRTDPGGQRDDPIGPSNSPTMRGEDSITTMLDNAYKLADDYLDSIATRSGGRLTRADTLSSLPAAFAEIARELRTQYSLGYYPTHAEQNGQYHKIQVKSTRKGVILRARPGYRAPDASAPSRRRR